MRNPDNALHPAIPCRDLDEAWQFYMDGLACASGTRYDGRLTLDFFGDQIVCHLSPDQIDPEPAVHPRHFGLTLARPEDFERILRHAREHQLEFFKEPFVRFAGERRQHRAFFLRDPSNKLLEFKHYEYPETMY